MRSRAMSLKVVSVEQRVCLVGPLVGSMVRVPVPTGLEGLAKEVLLTPRRAAEEEQARAVATLVERRVVGCGPELLGHEPGLIEDDEEYARAVAADLALRGRERDDLRAVREPDARGEVVDHGAAGEPVRVKRLADGLRETAGRIERGR